MQEQMRQDSSWIRSNPANDMTLASRTHGQHYIYNYAPNDKERMEMAMRSLGRQYDWDMEKFRNDKKPADRGNKRRFIKNFFRFMKNPIGYSTWKLQRLATNGRKGTTFFFAMFPVFFLGIWLQTVEDNMETEFFVAIGDKINGHRGSGVGPYDQVQPFPWAHQDTIFVTYLKDSHYVANPTWKMNFKKHREVIDRNREAMLGYFNASTLREAHARNFGF